MKSYFITGTDTDVGKTVATFALATLLKNKGIDAGVMKPVQCAGDDAEFLTNNLDLKDDFNDINPCYADEPLSPHIAFSRINKAIDVSQIFDSYRRLALSHDLLLVEGAGGWMVPLKDDFLVSDLARQMGLDVIIVARPGLGTINHTLLTIEQIRQSGLNVAGVVFCESEKGTKGVAAKTNPAAIADFGDVPVLGTIPYLSTIDREAVLRSCKKVNIDALVAPVKKSKTKSYIKDDKNYLWHPFTQMKDWADEDPLVIEHAIDNYLIDTDGNKYLDGISSLWVTVHGHCHPLMNKALRDQLAKLDHSTLLGLANTPSIELAKQLVKITPQGLDKVFYSDSGSTAAEVGVKMAYQYWQNIGQTKKTKIVHLANSYHGDTLGSVSIGGIDLFHKVYRNLIFKTIKIDFPDCYRAPKDKTYPDYAFECLDRFERMLEKESHTIAAFIAEPLVQGAAGMVVWPEGVLKRMAVLCKKYDVLFICDEVATGFGRTGKMFAVEHENVVPDIMCLAKGITGGYLPLAATIVSDRVYGGFLHDYKEMKTFFHGHTYTGNPLACRAALANLEIFRKNRVIKGLQPKIKFLAQKLKMFYNLPSVGDVRQKGFMVGIELVADRDTKKPFAWQDKVGVRVCQKARERGVIVRPLGNVIVLMPPLSVTKEQLAELTDAVYWAIDAVIEN